MASPASRLRHRASVACHRCGADTVLAGHAHFYERFAPQRADGTADPDYGLRAFTVGTGGKSHHGLSSTPAANSEVRESETFGILKLTLHAGSYDWSFAPEAGQSFSDSGTATCHGAPPYEPPPPPASEALTFAPSDDTTAKPGFPNANYGTYGQVEGDASPVERGYLKFGVSGIGSRRVTSAKLRVFVTNPSDSGGSFYRLASNDWSEGTLTAANAPPFESSPLASLGTANYQTWYEVDVSSLVTGDGTFSIGVASSSADGVDYASKERGADIAPQLRVTVEP